MAKRLFNHSAIVRLIPTPTRGAAPMEVLSFRATAHNKPDVRHFSKSRKHYKDNRHEPPNRGGFGSRLRFALRNTKVEWYPIPVGLGIGLLGILHFYKSQRTERDRALQDTAAEDWENGGRPPRRPRVVPSGGWQVQIMSTLPLKAMSRLWGRFNEIELPYYLRVPGFKLYAWVFGVNLDEVAEPDLHTYPNLAAFFYRKLKPGVRPLDPDPRALLSPADGRVLQFGMIERGEVEQVKGMTYSLDALLGSATPSHADHSNRLADSEAEEVQKDVDNMKSDEEFARVNGITYTVPSLLSGDPGAAPQRRASIDASTTSNTSSEKKVHQELALGEGTSWYVPKTAANHALFYVVIYLAPGDYHRFHSPTAWVVESRRHFAGELFSVSPYLQRTLPGLFTLNERVALLGRWRWGFFSYTPVGATNVGSIKINFDSELRTNSLLTDTAADMAAALAAQRGEKDPGFVEATYRHASPTLGGHPLQRGEEMGGFQLGSTVVLVFEAPLGSRKSFDAGWTDADNDREDGWKWSVEKGQRVKMGEKLGYVAEQT
ncbi:Phosphatidylserine decarboxylase-like protein [Penicillium chermesinum]|uniref:Phosphatidylserine decarboxylase proenzyme 1, mitochondrial n=1 Tax=Penicillium chermesinum TaxID=63820 RepID=A0A9W9TKR6_9EURO|nr:Phosphatidylserine decarboxylase-like protein [Penicillium chermesinum]KAJ5226308.1 Phosphatidylserine decarboxylase-like protein [Penicillium chermesinum]KAJ6160506.1 Phosphatidylserine decarboxylase-like protein [Penicillium chermesinum]